MDRDQSPAGPSSSRVDETLGAAVMNAWAALVITDLIAVATFARCFTGPGELTTAFTTLMIVHLAGLASRRRLLGRRRTWRLLGAVAAVCLPIAMVLGTTLFSRVPGEILVQVLRTGWATYYSKVAPVPELPGLVLATAWAAAAAGLLAEMISSAEAGSAVFALTPAVGIYLFASGFGTGSWRALGLARWQRRAAGTSPPSSVRTRAGRTDSWPPRTRAPGPPPAPSPCAPLPWSCPRPC